jgi:endo-1,4-beta-xylanase
VLALLKGFRDRGVPVDTLGVQSHIGFYGLNGSDPINGAINYNISNMKPFLDAVVAMGYSIKVTEMDVNDVNVPGTNADRDAATAAFAKAWLNLILSYGDSVKDVLFWGMCDRYSWLQDAAFGSRSDGQPKRPNPYDANFQPKPMRQSVIDAFTATTRRG